MNDSIGFFILISVFLAVIIHLIIYSKRRRKMIIQFAKKKNWIYIGNDQGKLEAELNKKLGFEENGMRRSFMGLKDIITDGELFLFRFIEFFGRSSQNTHRNHISVSFNISQNVDLFFTVDKNGNWRNIYPKDKEIGEYKYFKTIWPLIEKNLPKNSLTITLRNGKALVYVEPLVIGGEKEEDCEYLILLSKIIANSIS